MGQEIERKYLLKNMQWKNLVTRSVQMTQGYFPSSSVTVRVRIAGNDAFLTIKGKSDEFFVRSEFEYSIPVGALRYRIKEM